MIQLAPSTLDDCRALFADRPALRIRAMTAHVDGAPIAIGGLAYGADGAPIAFLEGYDAVKRFPVAVHKAVLRGLADARARGVRRIVALCDPGVEAAPRWLARLGFRQTGPAVWTWEA